MSLVRGPGVVAWEQQHQATPLSSENYLAPDFRWSVTLEQVGDSAGNPVAVAVVYDKQTNGLSAITQPGIPLSTPAPPASTTFGFDIGFPPNNASALLAVAQAISASWCGVYIGGPNYAGSWNPALAQSLKGSLQFLPIYVGANTINGKLEAGPLTADNGAGHGSDALVQLSNYGFPTGLVMLDIEAETYFADGPNTVYYAEGWIQAVRDGGGVAGIYSCKACLDAIAQRVDPIDATWLANWDGVAGAEGYDIHQYSGSTLIAGLGVDLNFAAAGFQFQKL